MSGTPPTVRVTAKSAAVIGRVAGRPTGELRPKLAPATRGLHSSIFQLNLSRFGHTFTVPPV